MSISTELAYLKESDITTEDLDPRIQEELEKLNISCDNINKLESELEEEKSNFCKSQIHCLRSLNDLERKIGSSVQKARPYFEALKTVKLLQDSTEKAAHEFRKATSLHQSAKETLNVAEHNLSGLSEISTAWQEHLSETILKMNVSKKELDKTEQTYQERANEYQRAEVELQKMENKLQRHIIKAEVYFHESNEWSIQVEKHQERLSQLIMKINEKKNEYREAMKSLSIISEEIHSKRKT